MIKKVKVPAKDLSGLMFCLKGIAESNPILKREAGQNFNKTALNCEAAFHPVADKLGQIQEEKSIFEREWVKKMRADEHEKKELTEEEKASFFKELAELRIVEREKETLDEEVEVELHCVKFSLVKDMNYAMQVTDSKGVKRMPDYTLIDKYEIIYK